MASSQCCDNPPALNPNAGEGKVVDGFGGLKAYLTGSDDAKAAVILISDVFGKPATWPASLASELATDLAKATDREAPTQGSNPGCGT
nr:unnamed protein product [Digitaria exilis]